MGGERLNMYLAINTADKITKIYLYDGLILKKEKRLEVGRDLSKVLLSEIDEIIECDFDKLKGLIVFVGPGSFTGLRIGVSTMNALAYGKALPIVGVKGEDWLKRGIERLENKENDKIVLPEYGGEANITQPKK